MKKTSSFILLLMLIIDFACFAQGKTLKITHPNGGEKIIAGSNTAITWEGCEATDPVTLEYSTDRGNSWNLITDKATGFRYWWKGVPKTFSDECQLRGTLNKHVSIRDNPLVLGMGTLECLAVHPKDPNIIATAGGKGYIYIYDLSKKRVIDTIGDGGANIFQLKISPDGETIASLDNYEKIIIWHLKTGMIQTIIDLWDYVSEYYNMDSYSQISYCPDNKRIAFSFHNKIRIFDVDSGKQTDPTIVNSSDLFSFAFSKDGKKIATCGRGLKLWEVKTGHCLDTLIDTTKVNWPDTEKAYFSVAFSPDGRRIAGGADNYVSIWDLTTGKLIISLPAVYGLNEAIAFSPYTSMIILGSSNQITLWDTKTNSCLYTLSRNNNWPVEVAYNSDGKKIIVRDGQRIRIWDANSVSCIDALNYHSNEIKSMAYSPDGSKIASGDGYGLVKNWDVKSGIMLNNIFTSNQPVASVFFSLDERRLTSVDISYNESIKTWDLKTGVCIDTINCNNRIRAFACFSDRRKGVSGDNDGFLRIWDLKTGKCLDTMPGFKEQEISLSISPDENKVACCGSKSGIVFIWDLKTGKCLDTLRTGAYAVKFSPDGKKIATGGESKMIKIWDVQTGTCTDTLLWHLGTITGLAYSPDGKYLASSSRDATIRIWDLATHKCLDTLTGFHGPVNTLLYSPDGQKIAGGGQDGTIRIWDPLKRDSLISQEDTSDSLFSIVDPSSVNDNQYMEKRLSVSPNPANNTLTISYEADKAGVSSIYICNILGLKLKGINSDAELGRQTSQVDISSLPAGTYYVVLQSIRGCEVKKLQVIR